MNVLTNELKDKIATDWQVVGHIERFNPIVLDLNDYLETPNPKNITLLIEKNEEGTITVNDIENYYDTEELKAVSFHLDRGHWHSLK